MYICTIVSTCTSTGSGFELTQTLEDGLSVIVYLMHP